MPTKWEHQSGLIGFVRVNNAHNGVRLGQVLFKVIQRAGIEHKVGPPPLLLTFQLTVFSEDRSYHLR
jgi:hypothetical protein